MGQNKNFARWYDTAIKLFHVINCFVLFYTFLVLFLVPILLFLLYRGLLSLVFLGYYKGKYKLMDTFDSTLAIDKPGNVLTINTFMFVKGPSDITALRRRVENVFVNFQTSTGKRPYERMLCAIIQFSGLMCWENTRDVFDITHHVRPLPGASDPKKLYTEAEMFSAVTQIADQMWPEDRPRWEVLVVPRLQKDGEKEEHSAILFKIHHAYADGVSIAQICRLVLSDQPPVNFYFDPVNPPVPQIPWYVKALSYMQVFFLGPHSCLRLMSVQEKHIFSEGPLQGPKYFGRSHASFPNETIKNIRTKFNCCTSSIQHSVFLGAMQVIAERKGLPMPTQIIGMCPFAKLPFPDEYPRNYIYFSADNFPIGIRYPIKRLRAVDTVYRGLSTSMYDKIASRLLLQILGLFPAFMIEKSFGAIQCSYLLSNVPGMRDAAKVDGYPVSNLFAHPGITNGIRYGVGITLYKAEFTFGFVFEHSNVIECRQDVDDFIREFEKQIEYLNTIPVKCIDD